MVKRIFHERAQLVNKILTAKISDAKKYRQLIYAIQKGKTTKLGLNKKRFFKMSCFASREHDVCYTQILLFFLKAAF